MQYDILTVEPATDDDWKASDTATRRWWARVYQLMNDTGADIQTAIKAVQAADEDTTQCDN